jgi:hypothetical protein
MARGQIAPDALEKGKAFLKGLLKRKDKKKKTATEEPLAATAVTEDPKPTETTPAAAEPPAAPAPVTTDPAAEPAAAAPEPASADVPKADPPASKLPNPCLDATSKSSFFGLTFLADAPVPATTEPVKTEEAATEPAATEPTATEPATAPAETPAETPAAATEPATDVAKDAPAPATAPEGLSATSGPLSDYPDLGAAKPPAEVVPETKAA